MTPADRDKLIAILGMLGSDHAGERAAAGLAASNLLHKLDLTWSDVVSAVAVASIAGQAVASPNAPAWGQNAYQQPVDAYQAQMNAAYQQMQAAQAQHWGYNPYANAAFGRGY